LKRLAVGKDVERHSKSSELFLFVVCSKLLVFDKNG